MHLNDSNDTIKAFTVYQEFRIGRCNFVELMCLHIGERDQAHEVHLMRNLKAHLGNMRFCYILYQAD